MSSPDPDVVCKRHPEKWRGLTELQGKVKIDQLQKKKRGKRTNDLKYLRLYFCKFCKGFHLTTDKRSKANEERYKKRLYRRSVLAGLIPLEIVDWSLISPHVASQLDIPPDFPLPEHLRRVDEL